jgi:hypothetical protein
LVARRPASIEDDAVHLAPWAAAFEAVCGEPVMVRPLDPADPAAGQCLTFPRVFTPIELIGGIGHFERSVALREHVRQLGFEWDTDGRVMTVPAPGALNARLATRGRPAAGFRVAYTGARAPAMPLGPWLLSYLDGVITVLINAPEFYTALLRAAPHEREQARWGLMSTAHDLSVHALNYHLIPHSAVTDLAERIRIAVPGRYAAWSEPRATAPLTLTYFFDNDLNRYAYAVWCRCEQAEDFTVVFGAPQNYAQLIAALETRLAETQSGIGDVASGDFDDMAPLTETTFEVE